MDALDHRIITALQEDARLSNKELAARVGLAPSSCLARVRKLWQSGVLRGAHAEVSPEAVGVGLQAMVALRLRDHAAEAYHRASAALRELPEVLAAYHLSGHTDLLAHVAVRDAAHLKRVVVDHISGLPGVRGVETSLIFESTPRRPMPIYLESGEVD